MRDRIKIWTKKSEYLEGWRFVFCTRHYHYKEIKRELMEVHKMHVYQMLIRKSE